MKMRARGSQLAAQTVWMLSLPNPKLGACKFSPVLGCWWGRVALPAERRFGAWLWTQHLLSLVPALQGMTGTETGCPVQGWQGCSRSGGRLVQGGSALSWAWAGAGQAPLLPLRCRTLPGARSQAASRRYHHHQTQRLGTGCFPGKALLPHGRYLFSLQFWAVVSGQQQRPPHIQLLWSLGSHRLAGHAAGAGGREQAGGRLPRQSHAAPLTPPEQEPDLAS